MGLVVALCVEPVPALSQISAKSWAAWLYLLVFGTMVALNAYLWLLQNTTAALAGSYSFVNPAVALLLIRPCEVLSRVANVTILEVANNALRVLLQHRHVIIGSLA